MGKQALSINQNSPVSSLRISMIRRDGDTQQQRLLCYEGDGCRLTARELQIVTLIGKPMTTKEIAASLKLAPSTVSSYRKAICRKLNVHSTAYLVHWAAMLNKPAGPLLIPEVVGGCLRSMGTSESAGSLCCWRSPAMGSRWRPFI